MIIKIGHLPDGIVFLVRCISVPSLSNGYDEDNGNIRDNNNNAVTAIQNLVRLNCLGLMDCFSRLLVNNI